MTSVRYSYLFGGSLLSRRHSEDSRNETRTQDETRHKISKIYLKYSDKLMRSRLTVERQSVLSILRHLTLTKTATSKVISMANSMRLLLLLQTDYNLMKSNLLIILFGPPNHYLSPFTLRISNWNHPDFRKSKLRNYEITNHPSHAEPNVIATIDSF